MTGNLSSAYAVCGWQSCVRAESYGALVGGKHPPEYKCWLGMLGRCRQQWSANFKNYGGRGIKVCERWQQSFSTFSADMGPRPSPDHSIDRIDVNGDYEPSNCRWATRAEQSANKRSNIMLTHDGETLCVAEWARRKNMKRQTIDARLAMGWTVDEALTLPLLSNH